MKKLLAFLGTYFKENGAPDIMSSRRTNALVYMVVAIVYIFVAEPVDPLVLGVIVAASVGDTALTLKR